MSVIGAFSFAYSAYNQFQAWAASRNPCGKINETPDIGNKIEYAFGNATGNEHNIARSKAMEAVLDKIGIKDDAAGRSYITEMFNEAFSHIAEGENVGNGRIRVDSLLSGKYGFAQLETIWEGNKLITFHIKG